MKYFITGAAGFIGAAVTKKLLETGADVIGLDSLNDYYAPQLKQMRLRALFEEKKFSFYTGDLENRALLEHIFSEHKIDRVIHLAAQAGVRFSITHPHTYGSSNLVGFLNILEVCRQNPVEHVLFASSSSVYGMKNSTPFKEDDWVDNPVSLYAATKKANELMAHSYSHLYGIPLTGLRFFTVYGPMGRPDMAYFKFAQKIMHDQPIEVYNNGDLYRDFTYIDDIVQGITLLADYIPHNKKGAADVQSETATAPYAIYNIGNENPENLLHFIELLEKHLGKKAEKVFLPMQAGDVYITAADTSKLYNAVGWKPHTPLDTGLELFSRWFLEHQHLF